MDKLPSLYLSAIVSSRTAFMARRLFARRGGTRQGRGSVSLQELLPDANIEVELVLNRKPVYVIGNLVVCKLEQPGPMLIGAVD